VLVWMVALSRSRPAVPVGVICMDKEKDAMLSYITWLTICMTGNHTCCKLHMPAFSSHIDHGYLESWFHSVPQWFQDQMTTVWQGHM
jgi:hypothetical protein